MQRRQSVVIRLVDLLPYVPLLDRFRREQFACTWVVDMLLRLRKTESVTVTLTLLWGQQDL